MATFWAILGKMGNFLFHHLVTLTAECFKAKKRKRFIGMNGSSL